MFSGLLIISIIFTCYQIIKEMTQPVIPAENWANKDLYYDDVTNGMSEKQRMENLLNGKYKLEDNYPEPHKSSVTGKIVIENYKLYRKDVSDYGAVQAQKWVRQGKYNLTAVELEAERKQIRKRYERLYNL